MAGNIYLIGQHWIIIIAVNLVVISIQCLYMRFMCRNISLLVWTQLFWEIKRSSYKLFIWYRLCAKQYNYHTEVSTEGTIFTLSLNVFTIIVLLCPTRFHCKAVLGSSLTLVLCSFIWYFFLSGDYVEFSTQSIHKKKPGIRKLRRI